MKLIRIAVLLLLLSANTVFSAPYSIVFVHIGKQVPFYLETAIAQAALFNPNAEIILIANASALQKFPKKSLNVPLTKISCESLPQSPEHLSFIQTSTVHQAYARSFWSVTIERFFYLEEFMSKYQYENVFHLENDNMLYVNLLDLLPLFKAHYKGIGATFDNDQRVIPGFVYFSNPSVMHQLAEFLVETSKKGIIDMEALALFKTKYGKDAIDYLPILSDRYVETVALGSKDGGFKTTEPAHFHNHFDQFNSIFDAAAIGQYLGGQDPQHHNPEPGYINMSCIFNPSYFSYEWLQDEQGRSVPYATIAGKKCRINSLHIHCKRLDEFYSK